MVDIGAEAGAAAQGWKRKKIVRISNLVRARKKERVELRVAIEKEAAIEIYGMTGFEKGLPTQWSKVEIPSVPVRCNDIVKCIVRSFFPLMF